jgi:transcriptional regulator with XRE-family HTH domain
VSLRKSVAEKRPPRPTVLRPLGAQLRRLRLDRQLTQETLAELAGLNYKYIGKIELGKADPGADVLVRLSRALGVPVGALFETITPTRGGPPALPLKEVEGVTSALQTLTAAVERLLSDQPARPPARAPRRRRR